MSYLRFQAKFFLSFDAESQCAIFVIFNFFKKLQK